MKSTTIFRLRYNRKYITFVVTSHGTVCVEFNPIVLFSRVENSQYSTSDPEVITALKKSCDYGSLFYIEEEGKEAPSVVKDSPASVDPASSEEEGDTNTPAPNEGGSKSDEPRNPDINESKNKGASSDGLCHDQTVTSKNKAIVFLQENYGAKFLQTTEISAMKEEALVTYNVIFDNWK